MKKVVLSFWILLAVVVFFSSQKDQIIINKQLKKHIATIFPEGWGFFTKNPRDLLLDIYEVKNNEVTKIVLKNNSWNNLLGLSRKTRVIAYEASIIANEIPLSEWKDGQFNEVNNFINDTAFVVKEKLGFNHITEGDYIIKTFTQVPYAWAQNNQEKNTPSNFVKIRIKK